jgi:hypothetical protein
VNTILYTIICLVAVGCAATVAKYDVCLGFCAVLEVDKKATPEHVTKTIRETVTQ